ncbi:MAG: hypothetical protein AB9903_21990 [Vulcanimicrobiota bacterium]
MKKLGFVLFLLFILIYSGVSAAEFDARQIIEHLYITSGQEPVIDMVVGVEESVVSHDDGKVSMKLCGKSRICFKCPYLSKIETIKVYPDGSTDQKKMEIIRDGKNVRQWIHSEGKCCPVKDKKNPYPSRLIPCIPFGIFQYPENDKICCMIAGKEVIDSVASTKVTITSQAWPYEEDWVFIDTKRWIPLKVTVRTTHDSGEIETREIVYNEITETKDHRFFPRKLSFFTNGSLQHVIVIKSLAINVGLDDKMFRPKDRIEE